MRQRISGVDSTRMNLLPPSKIPLFYVIGQAIPLRFFKKNDRLNTQLSVSVPSM